MTPIVRDKFDNVCGVRFEEFQVLGKRIDVLYVRDDLQITSIELKVRDWSRGLRQCVQNRVISSRSYLAIWHEFLGRVPVDVFRREGVGLISVSKDNVEIVLEAEQREVPAKEILKLISIEGRTVGDIVEQQTTSLL